MSISILTRNLVLVFSVTVLSVSVLLLMESTPPIEGTWDVVSWQTSSDTSAADAFARVDVRYIDQGVIRLASNCELVVVPNKGRSRLHKYRSGRWILVVSYEEFRKPPVRQHVTQGFRIRGRPDFFTSIYWH